MLWKQQYISVLLCRGDLRFHSDFKLTSYHLEALQPPGCSG